MDRAFIFPGQASQYVGMGQDLYEKYDLARKYFDKANEVMNLDLKKICFEGPEDDLKQTFITQPAIYVHSTIVYNLMRLEGRVPLAVAGHSLGEYSALVAAESISFEDGLKLVKKRSELMHKAGQEKPGTMAALIGMNPDQVNELCDKLYSKGIIQPANFNCPGQIAVSGDRHVILDAINVAKEMGAKMAVELVVSGAFHSPLMQSAAEGLREELNATVFKNTTIPFYSNVDANPTQDSAKIKELLLKQLTSPVLWQNLTENMIRDGYREFYEVGPGNVLKGLLKRINRSVSCDTVGKITELEKSEGEA
ncbi:MAG: ACP S-malonyltransferase [Calditrichaceae bacterium]